jgi:hypothetical protein
MRDLSPTFCALVVVAAAAFGTPAPAAATETARDTNAAGACRPVNSLVHFSYSNNYLTNSTTTDQYVVCQFQMNDDFSAAAPGPAALDVAVATGATAGFVLCSAQEGSFYGGSNYVTSSNQQNYSLAANSNHYMVFTTSALTRTNYWETLTLICRIPAGGKMGLIEWYQ